MSETTTTTPASGAWRPPASTGLWARLGLPDWSQVTSAEARHALAAIAGLMERASAAGFDDEEDRVRRAVLELYARAGAAPSAAEIARETELDEALVGAKLEALDGRDLLVLDGGAIVGAYPFSERATGHRVRLDGCQLNAMCAIDALGVGAMYGRDVTIDSECRACGAAIRLATRGAGAALEGFTPPATVVWSGIRFAGRHAAESLCTVLAFFCGDDHLEAWRSASHPGVEGYRLTPQEAMEVGRGIFAAMLRPAPPADHGDKT